MIHVDGSQGEGGGQIVRSSLALSLVTGRPVTITRIRAGRKKPGLLKQHLTAVRAAAEISEATVDGDRLGAERLVFRPGPVRPGAYTFRIGTAGSTTLVFQTVLPALMLAEGPSHLFLEGGTHNAWAPPFDFLKTTFLPCLAMTGPRVDVVLERYGFFPAGGGRFRATVAPARSMRRLELLEATPTGDPRVRVVVARLPEAIGWRECRTITRALGWDESVAEVETVNDSSGPGNVVMIVRRFGRVTELFTGFGRRGLPAEKVAEEVVRQYRRHETAGVPVGEHLADQLLLPLALAASREKATSRFKTLSLSRHAETQIDLIPLFLDVHFEVRSEAEDVVCVRVGPGTAQSSAASD